MVDFVTLDQPTLISRKIVVTVKLRNFHTVLCISVFALKLKKLADLPTKSISILISLFHETFFQWEWIFCFSTLCGKMRNLLSLIYNTLKNITWNSLFCNYYEKYVSQKSVRVNFCTVPTMLQIFSKCEVKSWLCWKFDTFTATPILREIRFWWFQKVQKCHFLQF